MKRFLLFILLFSPFLTIRSQDFVGKDVQLYLNNTVKPIEKSESLQKYHYQNFYLQFDTITKTLKKEPIGWKKESFKPYQTGESYSPVSDYAKLVGMEFKVVGIYEENRQYEFEKGRFFVLVLENESLGKIYYEYDAEFEHNLELSVVGGLKFPDKYWCNKLTIVKDKFEDKTSYYSPQESGFIVIKIVTNDRITYYLDVETGGHTVNVSGKGLYILFEDGSKISKPQAEIDVKVGNKYTPYIYSAFIELSKEDLEIMKTKKITDKRLYIYDGTVNPEAANLIQEYTKCIVSE